VSRTDQQQQQSASAAAARRAVNEMPNNSTDRQTDGESKRAERRGGHLDLSTALPRPHPTPTSSCCTAVPGNCVAAAAAATAPTKIDSG